VTILDGSDAPSLHLRLMRATHAVSAPAGMVMGHDDELGHDRAWPVDEYLEHVRSERRLIYEFSIERIYGNF
jgi:hypothetical protein